VISFLGVFAFEFFERERIYFGLFALEFFGEIVYR
jgi:hypothetical protein